MTRYFSTVYVATVFVSAGVAPGPRYLRGTSARRCVRLPVPVSARRRTRAGPLQGGEVSGVEVRTIGNFDIGWRCSFASTKVARE